MLKQLLEEQIRTLLTGGEVVKTEGNQELMLVRGSKYLFRSVTMIYTGEVVDFNDKEILLTKAAWIADTGRWADNLKSCEFSEVEPYYKNVVICRGGLVDYTPIDTLPLEQK